MAKSKSKTVARRRKARNAKRAERAAGKAERVVISHPKERLSLDFIFRRAGNEGNAKKRRNKAACRKKVDSDE
jgi:hypothetical protein